MSTTTTTTKTCRKCQGTGHLSHFDYSDYGRCWGCGGTGVRDFAAERSHKAKLAEAYALPAMNDLITFAQTTGLRYRAASQAARIFQRTHLDRIWGEDSFTGTDITDEDIAAAMTLFDGMVK